MNSDSNNVLSQNWVGCTVHTPMAQAAHRPRVHCAVSWGNGPYRGPLHGRVALVPGRVLALAGAPCRAVSRARSCCIATQHSFFPICYSPSTQITQHPQQSILYTQLHIKHNACSVLILSRDCLGNHIPKLQHRVTPSCGALTL